jgi:predicted dehydrogenase
MSHILDGRISRRQSLVMMSSSLLGASTAVAKMPGKLRLPGRIRIALIGLDGHPDEILTPLSELPDAQVIAFADVSGAVRDRAAKMPALSSARLYESYNDMLKSERQIDVLAVCNNNGERAAAVLAGLKRGVNVIAEKPLALQREDLQAIRRQVGQQRTRIGMLLPMRFSPTYLALKRIVESGELGEVVQAAGQKSYKLGNRPDWMRKRATYGGTIAWIGIHMIDLMRWTSGREMTEVVSYQTRIGAADAGEMETVTTSMFRLDNGGLAALKMDYMRPQTAPSHGDDRLRLAGTKGIAEYQAATGVTVVSDKRPPRTIDNLPASRHLFVDFLDSVYNGKPTLLPMEDIFRINEITIAAQESADQHRIVPMALVVKSS